MSTITSTQLKAFLPKNTHLEEWAPALEKFLPKYEINTKNRISAFMAQCAHESAEFTAIKENLNYGAPGLLATFKKYFPTEDLAKQYERKPEKIANRVYASRMGNGDEASGDGFKFCGRGLIQITGKDNYTRFGKSIDMDVDKVSIYMTTIDGAVESACWFWKVNNLNKLADVSDIKQMTKIINGGYNGLEDRQAHYDKALKIFTA
jgi:putative chitinase